MGRASKFTVYAFKPNKIEIMFFQIYAAVAIFLFSDRQRYLEHAITIFLKYSNTSNFVDDFGNAKQNEKPITAAILEAQ